jgi:hypothetical protein
MNANNEPVYYNNWVKEMLPEQSDRTTHHETALQTDSPCLEGDAPNNSVLRASYC